VNDRDGWKPRRRVAKSARSAFALCLAVFGLLLACAGRGPLLPAPEGGAVAVAPETALSFQQRAEGFYLRLAFRRFNTIETFDDFILRDHFQSPDLFFDYYADLAQSLGAAHFEKRRPESVRVAEFVFENPGSVRVLVVFQGADGRPLRPGSVRLERVDRWEWQGGTWWIRPGKV